MTPHSAAVRPCSALISGNAGHLGRLAIAAQQARGAMPVALVRSPEKATGPGVEVRPLDYASADPAVLKGVDTLVLISSSDFNDRAGQHRNAIAAAKEAGVGRIVYTSILKGDANPMLLAADHIATEAALTVSGIPATILRNGWYAENYTAALGAADPAGQTDLPAPLAGERARMGLSRSRPAKS